MLKRFTYSLKIDDDDKYKLLDYYVSHSIFTPSAKCVVLTDKPVKKEQKITLSIGYETPFKVFQGTIYKVEKLQDKYKIYADSIYHLRKGEKTLSLKDVNPKDILNHIGIKKIIYTQKNLIEKHHFPILQMTPLQIIKQIIKVWNLKDFVYFLDLEGALHFHRKDEHFKKVVKTEQIITQDTQNTLIMPLFTEIFINQILQTKENQYKVLSLTHTKGKTYLEIENV